MTHMLMGLAQGKLVVCLEVCDSDSCYAHSLLPLTCLQGGYNLTSISKSALAVTRTLIGEEPDRLPPARPTDVGFETVQMVAMYQSVHWPCLSAKDVHEGICCPNSLQTSYIDSNSREIRQSWC